MPNINNMMFLTALIYTLFHTFVFSTLLVLFFIGSSEFYLPSVLLIIAMYFGVSFSNYWRGLYDSIEIQEQYLKALEEENN
jgi:ABC-type multidrug transport system permease subunit